MEKKERSDTEISTDLKKRAKTMIVEDFEKVVQAQQKALMSKFNVMSDWRLSDQYREAIISSDFDPGDDLMVELYLKQNKMEQLVRERYEQRH